MTETLAVFAAECLCFLSALLILRLLKRRKP